MTWARRLEAIGVIGLALAGLLTTAAASLGLVPATPPQVVGAFIGLLAIAKTVAAAGGVLAFLTGRG